MDVTETTMQLETKILRLRQPVELGAEIDGWRVSCLGGWGKDRIFFFVMVVRETEAGRCCTSSRLADKAKQRSRR